jgi:hypothetical protein
MKTVADNLFKALENPDVRRATIFVSPKLTAKATRQRKYDRRAKAETFLVTVGVPNYLERAFIKLLKKAKEPFPVKKVQIKFWPKKKK